MDELSKFVMETADSINKQYLAGFQAGKEDGKREAYAEMLKEIKKPVENKALKGEGNG